MDEFCYSSDKPEGPIFSSSNVLTFVFDSDGSVTRRGYFISVSAGINLLPPATKLGQGYVFTGVCDSVHRGGSASVHAGIPHPPSRRPTPPRADAPRSRPPWEQTPLEQTPPTPWEQTPREQTPSHQCRACWELRPTRGRYASYWNAILFIFNFILMCSIFFVLQAKNTLFFFRGSSFHADYCRCGDTTCRHLI